MKAILGFTSQVRLCVTRVGQKVYYFLTSDLFVVSSDVILISDLFGVNSDVIFSHVICLV